MLRYWYSCQSKLVHGMILLGILGISATSFPIADKSVNVKVTGTVPAIQQPTDNTCWATAATMLKSWKDGQSESIDAVMHAADSSSGTVFGFAKSFAQNKALSGSRKPDFLRALGLKAEGPQTFTVQGWADLLKNRGPLWVTTNEGTQQNFAVHARTMIAIAGDGSPEATFVIFIDPADGQQHTESIAVFTKKLEDIAKSDLGAGADLRPQVVHF